MKRKRVICRWVFCMSLPFVITSKIKLSECFVWFQWFTQWYRSCVSNIVPCWCDEKRKRVICWWMIYCVFLFIITLQIELSECCVWFQCFAQWCCSTSFNMVVCWWNNNFKSLFLLLFIRVYYSDLAQWVLCLISMIHLMMLLLLLRYRCLLIRREMKKLNCWWMSFVCILSLVFTSKIKYHECCVWFQCLTQWCCSYVSNVVPCWWVEKRKKCDCLMDVFCVSSFFCLYSPDWVR